MKKTTKLPKPMESTINLRANSSGKLEKNLVRYCLSCMMIIFFLPLLISSNDGMAKGNETRVLEAYELRISGKADKAEELISELLKNDSTNALAYFELARTKHHLFLGGTQFSSEAWKEVMQLLQHAVRYEPGNEVFAFYYAYSCFFDAFISMMRQNADAGEKIALACDAFNAVLKFNPNCHEAQLYMADIYGSLPQEIGGDKKKARIIAEDLSKRDAVYGAMANARLLSDTSDFVLYWRELSKRTGIVPQVMEELGRAYLLKYDTDNGTKFFFDAIQADITRRYLYMHLVRYHILSTQQNPDAKAMHLEEAAKLTNRYLLSSPELTAPLKAYATGILALIKMISGDENGSEAYREEATSIDPFYSKAMGMPPAMLYCRPDEVKIQYSSFFMPF